MKLEFIKETNLLTGKVFYSTQKNGILVDDSTSLNYNEARIKFLLIKSGEVTKIEILQTFEI